MNPGTTTEGMPSASEVELLLRMIESRDPANAGSGSDLRSETVLERRDDPAPGRVVLGLAEATTNRSSGRRTEAADLDVALFEDVEEAHLDPFGEVGQLVDGEDPAVAAG